MEGEDEESDNPRAFGKAKLWQRMIIIVAGAFNNILLGLVLMCVLVVQEPVYASTTIESFHENAKSSSRALICSTILYCFFMNLLLAVPKILRAMSVNIIITLYIVF